MNRLHKFSLIAILAVGISIFAVSPVMADDDDDDDDDDDSWGKKKQLDNQVALMETTKSVKLQPGERLEEIYVCEKGEIMLGGIVENHSSKSISEARWNVDHQDQSFSVNISNRDPAPLTVNVTYLCASMKS